MLQKPVAALSRIPSETNVDQSAVTPTGFLPLAVEQFARLKCDLALGLPVILRDDGRRVLVALIEKLTADRFASMVQLGAVEISVTARRAAVIGGPPYGTARAFRAALPTGADLDWVQTLAGMGAGIRAAGALSDAGSDLTFLTGRDIQATTLEMAIRVPALPAALTVRLGDDLEMPGLMSMSHDDLSAVMTQARDLSHVSAAVLPMDIASRGRVHVFRPNDAGLDQYAIEIGSPDLHGPVTVRLHSACFTGDVLGSLKCDCGPQLRAAMAAMAAAGGGVLLYLNQEGRGIGLANKMRAYALQDDGLDTVEANHALGFEDDHRDFRIGASLLRWLGIRQVRLMTNNPSKVASLETHGIKVCERVPLVMKKTAENAHYLATKAVKSGHIL